MSPRARALIGVITTFFFAAAGAMLLAEQRTVMGGVLLGLAALRGLMALQQIRDLRADDEDEGEA